MIDHSSLQVVNFEGKGRGIVARVDLPANARLIYQGKEINKKRFSKLNEREKGGEVGVASYIGFTGRSNVWMDANPRLKGYNQDLYIAGLINEPAPGEVANSVLVNGRVNGVPHLLFVTVKPIPRGTELTIKYGSTYRRAYQVGEAAKRPKWL